MGEGETPSDGVSSGSGWLANRVTSVKDGRKRFSFGLCVFSGSFGVQSIVLCKCSGKYIDIYFILKITFHLFTMPGDIAVVIAFMLSYPLLVLGLVPVMVVDSSSISILSLPPPPPFHPSLFSHSSCFGLTIQPFQPDLL